MQVTITPSRSKHQKVIITIIICFETWASCTVHDTVPATFPLAKLGRWNWPNQEPTIPKLMELATDRSSTKTPQHFFSHAPCDQSISVSYNEWLSRHVSIQSVKKSFQPQSEWTIITQPVQQATSPSACPSVCTSVMHQSIPNAPCPPPGLTPGNLPFFSYGWQIPGGGGT